MANPIDNVEDQLPEIEDQQLAMEKPFKCQFCEHRTKRRSSLETHVRCKHTFEEPYECDHCGMRFKVQSNLARHVRTHTGVKPHICAVCGKEYADKKNLDAHMEVEHEGRPQFECAYPGCGKRFARQDKFDHHRRHTNHNVPL